MINFASLFSQFRNNTSSAINQLLESPATTSIDRLLDEDSFPNEYKSGNAKVMEYMKYNRYEELVNYVTIVGPADDKKKGYKYPLVASDILSSDNSTTIEFFFPQNDIIVEQTKDITREVEVEVEVDENDEEQNKKTQTEKAEPKTVIQDELEGQDNTVITQVEPEKEKPKQSEQIQKQTEAITQIQQQKQGQAKTSKKKKLVKKMQTFQETQRKKKEPLIRELFAYFSGQVNYTLAGYTCKILVSFYNKKPITVMNYLLDEGRIELLLNHIQSRSVGELLTKIMTHQSNDLLEKRKVAYERILARLSINNQIYIMSNLSVCVCQIIEKVAVNLKSQTPIQQFTKLFFTPVVITKVITNVMADEENVSVYNAPVLLTYLTNVPLNIPDDKDLIEQFKKLLTTFLSKALEKINVTKQTRRTLGVGRIKIIEIIGFILKADILEFRNIVGQNKQLFPILFSLCRNYQMNNILHNQVIKMIELALSLDAQPPAPFLLSLVNNNLLLNFIFQEGIEDIKIKAGNTNRKSRKGYIGHIISLAQKLKEKAESNPTIKALCQRQQFVKIFDDLVSKQTIEQKKSLAGFSLKKGNGQSILFMKEDVLQTHFKFLAACPSPVFEPEPEHINIEHPDLQRTHAITIENPAQAIEAIIAAQSVNSENVNNASENFNPKFWTSHINYDINALIDDL